MVKPQEDPPLNLNMVVIWIHVMCDAVKDLVGPLVCGQLVEDVAVGM